MLKRTYAYHRLSQNNPEIAEQLIESTRIYAEQLKNLPEGFLTLVDSTGFSPESIMELVKEKPSFDLSPGEWSPSKLFRANGEGMRGLVGALLKVREMGIPTVGRGDSASIAGMLDMWVNGKSIREIADKCYSDEVDISTHLTDCCRMLYQSLTHQVSWGFGALQSICNLKIDEFVEEERDGVRFVPSMLYYGVPTVEAVLMRSLGVPRSVSVSLGEQFVKSEKKEAHAPRIQEARRWLEKAPTEAWNAAVAHAGTRMDGKRLQKVWRIITGRYGD